MDDPLPVPAIRKCIRCNKPFKSQSSGNRICGRCKSDFHRISQRHIPLIPVITERDKE